MTKSVLWTVNVRQTILDKQSPSSQGLYLDNWAFEGILEGLSSGYIWTTKGWSRPRTLLQELYEVARG